MLLDDGFGFHRMGQVKMLHIARSQHNPSLLPKMLEALDFVTYCGAGQDNESHFGQHCAVQSFALALDGKMVYWACS